MVRPEADEHTITTRTGLCTEGARGDIGFTAAKAAWDPTTIDNATRTNTRLNHSELSLKFLIFHHLIISIGAIMILGRLPASVSELQEQQLLIL